MTFVLLVAMVPPETASTDNDSLVDLVRWAKWLWHIEQDYQQLKDELGIDHF